MSRTHQEIFHLARVLDRLIAGIPPDGSIPIAVSVSETQGGLTTFIRRPRGISSAAARPNAARIDAAGFWYISGRSDDTIKVAGKRIGPAEIESVLVSHPSVSEAAAVGVPDEITGEKIVCVCVARAGAIPGPELERELIEWVKKAMGSALKPSAIRFVDALPKTRNGKVMRRVIRAIYIGEDPGDLSALDAQAGDVRGRPQQDHVARSVERSRRQDNDESPASRSR